MADPHEAIWPTSPNGAKGLSIYEEDLIKLDEFYGKIYQLHRDIHVGLAEELAALKKEESLSTVLEVAGGTGWSATRLIDAGFQYWGLDLSETAIAVAMRRHPEARFINADIEDAGIIKDDAFDFVFCSSMLEHLKNPESALHQLVRIARRYVFILFFEGLTDEDDQIAQYPYTNPDYKMLGIKMAHLQRHWGGYYWNRYSRKTIEQYCRNEVGVSIEFLDSKSRPYITTQTVLRITK